MRHYTIVKNPKAIECSLTRPATNSPSIIRSLCHIHEKRTGLFQFHPDYKLVIEESLPDRAFLNPVLVGSFIFT